MKTLLEKKRGIRNMGIIILLVISSLGVALICITFCLIKIHLTLTL